ncbi:hypothetical protein HLB23_11855 [Nocardia uniformis]|uniref:Uncharacterized protein n=1 Tax=Nocardia uniformis TaxID=53432 RepID=A0A849C446_9NOCA|nr:hypothetical protein [Nocardia uniformis]NNH70547.1 hypothetical protein [Nocardia uniformis]
MNSASQSYPDAADARQLLGDIERLTARGWRMASPAWFPLLCVAVAVLASVPAGIALEGGSPGWYWLIVAPLTTIASSWYFLTRRAQIPDTRGVVLGLTGLAMLTGTMLFGALVDGNWAVATPWLVIGIGFGVFSIAMRSIGAAAFSAVTIIAAVTVAITEPAEGYAILAFVVGATAALAAFIEMVRADGARSR